jgi:MFS family permease
MVVRWVAAVVRYGVSWQALSVAIFFTLLLGRIGVGIGEAGAQPCTNSLLSDHYPADRRGSVLAIIALGGPFGFLMGQALGGWVAAEWGWRVAFFAMGIPGLLVAVIVWLTLREPPRGLVDGQVKVIRAPSRKDR